MLNFDFDDGEDSMSVEMSGKRLKFLDASKGIAIFLVVFGHVIQSGMSTIENGSPFDNVVYRIIYSFHMPLFMCVSGYFFHDTMKKGIKNVIMNRVSSLLVLLFFWNTIHYVCVLLIRMISHERISFSLNEYRNELFQGYWFLWAIMLYALVVGIGARIFHEKFQLLGILIMTPIILISPVRWVAITQFFYFLVGFFIKKGCNKATDRAGWRGINAVMVRWGGLVLFIILECIYLRTDALGIGAVKDWLDAVIVSVKSNDFRSICIECGKLLLFYGMGIAGSITVILWFRHFEQSGYDALMKVFGKLGRYSLQIYILQRIFVELISTKAYMSFVTQLGSNPLLSNLKLFTYVWSVLLTIFWLLLLYFVSSYIMKTAIGKMLLTGKVNRVDLNYVQSAK